ncbi:MAG: YkgJ family cysteine cluster protein [Planctomycetaceae bacterium]|nr:YkgJ family cysteine cluster protein [Planctomycetaceae bacterium]
MSSLPAATPFGAIRINRENLPEGRHLCEYCTAKCCRYFALPMETPETFEEFEFIRWFLLHDRASVFQEEGDWYMLVHTTCKHLGHDNRCGIYETRPQICRDYTTDNCEYDDDWTYDFYLETPEQVWEYTEAVIQEPGKSIRSRKPNPLAVLS